jgi:hypothetical protein
VTAFVQPDAEALDAAVAAATAESKWTTFTASDGDLAIRMRTEAERIEAMARAAVAAAAPVIAAAVAERIALAIEARAAESRANGMAPRHLRDYREAAAIARAGTSGGDRD